MLDPRKQAELDQAKAVLSEIGPAVWKAIYNRCVEEGFTEEQAFELTRVYAAVMVSARPLSLG